MTLIRLEKTPWPWSGGKSGAAPAVWDALGDVSHYVEPFAGSLAVLLRRPHEANRTYYSETVNDLDGLLVNAWRSMQWAPDEMAEAASWPVSEADMHARHLALVRWRAEENLERLMADPRWHDPVMGGWWAWGQSCWIGSGWASGEGSWVVGADGRIRKQSREPKTREPGVDKKRPHLTNGQGVNRPGTREPGVTKQLPHLNNGRGVNRPGTREPGVTKQLPHLSADGRGVNRPGTREPGVGEYHPMKMPELTRWFQYLSARLRHVRILNGDWKRATTNGAAKTLNVRMKDTEHAGIFLDPPYSTAANRYKAYAVDDFDVADDVREWCLTKTDDPKLRIILAGYDNEHTALEDAGWRVAEWFKPGFLTGGMGNTSKTGTHQQHRERLWFSPACLTPTPPDNQQSLWEGE